MKLLKSKFFLLIICCLLGIKVVSSQSIKPNIVFILADDFGYSSLNCYDADKNLVRTPHIDNLAECGMRFRIKLKRYRD